MKTKLIILALFVSMCSNQAQEKNEVKIISLSTTHTEIIQSLGAENTLIAVDAFSEVDFPVQSIDAYTVTAEELAPLDADMVIVAFDFNGIIEGLEAQERLRTVADPVEKFDKSLKKLTDDMLETMYAENGIGLAATQVNVHKEL